MGAKNTKYREIASFGLNQISPIIRFDIFWLNGISEFHSNCCVIRRQNPGDCGFTSLQSLQSRSLCSIGLVYKLTRAKRQKIYWDFLRFHWIYRCCFIWCWLFYVAVGNGRIDWTQQRYATAFPLRLNGLVCLSVPLAFDLPDTIRVYVYVRLWVCLCNSALDWWYYMAQWSGVSPNVMVCDRRTAGQCMNIFGFALVCDDDAFRAVRNGWFRFRTDGVWMGMDGVYTYRYRSWDCCCCRSIPTHGEGLYLCLGWGDAVDGMFVWHLAFVGVFVHNKDSHIDKISSFSVFLGCPHRNDTAVYFTFLAIYV